MNFIENLLDQTSELEPPRDYFYWTALAIIAATVKGNVFLDRHSYLLYPNIYVLLLGRSGMRKGVPISVAGKIMEMVNNNRVIAGCNTIEAVIKNLSKDYTLEGGGIIKDATALLLASEFSDLLQDNDQAFTTLTNLYDSGYHKQYIKETKAGGKEVLKGINLTMLGASNMPLLEDRLTAKDIRGGFIARTYLIYADKKRVINSLVDAPKKKIDFKGLVQWLNILKGLRGKFSWDIDAAKFYDNWYKDYNERQGRREDEDDDTGVAARFEDHILKVSMLIALAKNTDLVLRTDDIEESINSCTTFAAATERLMFAAKTDSKKIGINKARSVLSALIKAKPGEWIERSKLIRQTYGDLNANELDTVIDTLNKGKIVEEKPSPRGPLFRLSDEMYDKIMRGG